ncbi:hypothetical protein Ocin01_15728 [Orchesella cincta]|uniref:Transmembrane protein n=1 Tax=Orchesella cincta TaxID=48709 RepID=A0A1D2MDL2_ORCCI|nr:hypothetical protein Ocin01_15728 [Orchesella cincta]
MASFELNKSYCTISLSITISCGTLKKSNSSLSSQPQPASVISGRFIMKIFGIIAVIFAVVVAVASDKAAEKSPASACGPGDFKCSK